MNAHEHLSDDVLIGALYGLADVEAPVRECAQCASRWDELQEKRAVLCAPMEIPAEVLAAQRRQIHRAIEHPLRARWEHSPPPRWAAPAMAAAAACLLAIGVHVHHPVTPARSAPVSISEIQPVSDVYSDVYSMEQSFEPSATASIRVLFDSDGSAWDITNRDAEPGTSERTSQGTKP
jgi:hypothetical protein